LFLYVAHIFAIHAAASGIGRLRQILTGSSGQAIAFPPHNTGFPLPIVYLLWLFIVIALFLPCLWFGHWKQANRQKWWVSYL
jgi:hypothetical protein